MQHDRFLINPINIFKHLLLDTNTEIYSILVLEGKT